MLGAVTLFLIGSADIIRSVQGRRIAAVAIALIWGGACLVATMGLGLPLWWCVICLLIAALWLATTSSRQRRRYSAGVIPAFALGVVILAFLAFDHTAQSLSGFLVEWHESAPVELLRTLPLPTLVLAVSIALFLVSSSNIVVRAALLPGKQQTEFAAPAASNASTVTRRPKARRRNRGAARALDDQARLGSTGGTTADLRGGRLIGPVERLLITALTLSGSLTVVAAIVAAKGIVRFPEISRDSAGGSKAEYFLVGSLVSWAIAISLAGLLWVSAHG